MKILYNAPELMNGSELFSDYVNDPGRTAEFYPSHFRDKASLERIMNEISSTMVMSSSDVTLIEAVEARRPRDRDPRENRLADMVTLLDLV